jgi:POT family proton-dependent oligopeptide transporter
MSTPATTSPAPAAVARQDKLPPQTYFIVGNEACERFSFYGMNAILTLYMTKMLVMSRADATEISHLFKAAVYFLPLMGAWLADRWLGRYRTILIISLFYCLGHGVLAVSEGSRMGLYAGLFLIAVGSGGIKPCVSAFVGDQFGAGRTHLLARVYGLFYWSINFGSFFAFGLIPTIRENHGYSWAFGVPGIAMGVATLVFWLGRKYYVHVPPSRQQGRAGVTKIWWHAWCNRRSRQPGQHWTEAARSRFTVEEVAGARAVAGILVLFIPLPVFWALFDQTNSTWVLQGDNMRPEVLFSFHVPALVKAWCSPFLGLLLTAGEGTLYSFTLNSERMQSLNPLLVMIMIPVFTMWLYPLLSRLGLRVSPLRRMSVGMLLAAVSFAACGWIQAQMDGGQSKSILWQVLPYVLLTAGEVLFSATGLEFAFSQAPKHMRSTIMSFWLLTTAIGNFLVAALTNLNDKVFKLHGAATFYLYAGLMVAVGILFIFLAVRYHERNHAVEQELAGGAIPDGERL